MKTVKPKHVILYALSLALLLILLQWMQYRFLVIDHAAELYITGIAIIFTLLGIWAAKKLKQPKVKTIEKTVVVEKPVPVYRDPTTAFIPDVQMINRLQLSDREIEVLQIMSTGASNQEIADRLFVSVNTIKTHGARIFEKLDVNRRTHAIEKARRLNIIP